VTQLRARLVVPVRHRPSRTEDQKAEHG
jgi:hypothetical protein